MPIPSRKFAGLLALLAAVIMGIALNSSATASPLSGFAQGGNAVQHQVISTTPPQVGPSLTPAPTVSDQQQASRDVMRKVVVVVVVVVLLGSVYFGRRLRKKNRGGNS